MSNTDDTDMEPPERNYGPGYHYRVAASKLDGLQEEARWQVQHLAPEYRDRPASHQPPSPSGNRDSQMKPESFGSTVRDLQTALYAEPPSPMQQRERVVLLAAGERLAEASYELPWMGSLEKKYDWAIRLNRYREAVRDHLGIE